MNAARFARRLALLAGCVLAIGPATAQTGTNLVDGKPLPADLTEIADCAGEKRGVLPVTGASVVAVRPQVAGVTPQQAAATAFSSRTGRAADATVARDEQRRQGEFNATPFVDNGRKTRLGLFNETVAILNGPSKLCTGVLVADNAVLTAGHCVCNNDLDNAGTSPTIVFGSDINANSGKATVGATVRVEPKSTVLYDAAFCKDMKQFGEKKMAGRDLALLFLNPDDVAEQRQKATVRQEMLGDASAAAPVPRGQTIVLPDGAIRNGRASISLVRPLVTNETFPTLIATPQLLLSSSVSRLLVVGFGLGYVQGEKVRTAGPKRHACIDIKSRICGFQNSRDRYQCAPGREIVLADQTSGRDTCGGDSGGPTFAVVRSGSTLYYYLVGITSRGVGGQCGEGGVYSLVTPRVVDWMRSNGVAIANYEFPDQ